MFSRSFFDTNIMQYNKPCYVFLYHRYGDDDTLPRGNLTAPD